MAYRDYGAMVYQNGQRRPDKEDCPLFPHSKVGLFAGYCHGVMGDGDIRVKCYKQGLPTIWEHQYGKGTDKPGEEVKIEYTSPDTDRFEYDDIDFEYKGYKFHFISGEPYVAQMIEPDGTEWECKYDYGYGLE